MTTSNEALIQALIRFVVSGLLAALAFFVANATVLNGILVDAGADPIYAGIVTSLFVAVLNSITKFIGGATTQPTSGNLRQLDRSGGNKRPNPLAL